MLNKIKIGPKLIGGFLIVAAIAAVIGVFGIINLKTIDKADTMLYEKMTVPITYMSDVSTYFQRVRINSRDIVRANDPAEIAAAQKTIEDLSKKIADLMDEFEKLIISDQMKKAYNDFAESRNAYRANLDQIISLAKLNKDAEAYEILDGEGRKAAMAEQAAIDKIIELKTEDAKNTSANNTKMANTATLAMIITLLIGVFVAIGIGLGLTMSITKPLSEGVVMMSEMSKGHLNKRLSMNREDEIGILGKTMDSFADDLQKNVIGTMQKIADGDVSSEISAKDSADEISPALKKMIETIRSLISEAGMLRKAAVEGKLATRGDFAKFKGGYRDIVQGVNDTLDAVIGPLNVAAEYVDRISKGDIPQKITDNYNGDFNEIKNNLNRCIEALNGLINDMRHMSEEHNKGDIDVQIIVDKFEGVYKVMAQGVNEMVNGHLIVKRKAMACVGEFGKGNFDAPLEKFPGKKVFINEAIEAMRSNLKNIATEIGTLIEASKNGMLSTRGNTEKFTGDWQKMVRGVNEMLDAIIEPINEASSVLEKIANRDLTSRVKGEYKGDHAKIKNALNTAVDNLDKALSQVSEATEQVSSASQQISAGSQSLAQGSNEQASSLEEVSSSLEEMSSMTKQNADNANQAKNLAAEADGNAKSGTEAMERMSSAINKIKESSDQTAKIVKTIDEIAIQTNLLALNAAVEAARAGEAGRGFAVVAEEVRNLAQRSSQAAKNTADMISESVKNADDGVKISTEVSKSFESITVSAKKVNDLIAEIAAASQEQSQGIDQVNNAVAQMDKVTQQNAANSEESASAAEELSSQAQQLQSMVGQFMLSNMTKGHSSSSVYHSGVPQTHHAPVARLSHGKSKSSVKKNVHNQDFTAEKIGANDIIPMDDETLKEF